ncbi:MAG: hypothetical protein JSS79_03815 [Bacteroidetes bacterium]|nr:hypothetical protein [Bacteroidota bacterium]
MNSIQKQNSNERSFAEPDWQILDAALKNLSIQSDFRIHISKKEGCEMEIQIEKEPTPNQSQEKKSIHITPGLYDLFW